MLEWQLIHGGKRAHEVKTITESRKLHILHGLHQTIFVIVNNQQAARETYL